MDAETRIDEIRQRAQSLAEQFGERHPPRAVNQFVQFSLGVLALARGGEQDALGEEPDPISYLRASAKLAAKNVDPQGYAAIADGLLADEELCAIVLAVDQELR